MTEVSLGSIEIGAPHVDPGLERHVDSEVEELYRETVRTFDAQNIPLTPEMILLTVRRQLDDMDRQIRLSMLHVEGTHDRAEEIGDRIQGLRDLESVMRDSGAFEDGSIKIEKLNDSDGAALAEYLGINTAQDDESIVAAFDALMEREYGIDAASGDGELDLNVLENELDNLQEEQRQINAGNEMVMMQLQNAMQQRTQIIQTGSNFLASIHDAAKTIVGNLR